MNEPYEEFESDIRETLGVWIHESHSNGCEMWSAMVNTTWIHPAHGELGYLFRHADAVVLKLRDGDLDNRSYYCEGPIGEVSDRIKLAMADKGWTSTPME